MGPRKSVRYSRDIVITVKFNVVKLPFGIRKVELYLFVITVIVITEFDCIIGKNVRNL